MAYEVLARKWRPQQFDDIVGQEHVTRTLKNAIESDRVAHAYLFVGPRGIGKTTTARILAKALNCEQGPTPTPCDKCDSCREIMGGRSLDVLEIDGASNRGIDHIRELRDNVRYAPARGPFKIYIIDEVHMLTQESFNALLKTLEEPPPHVKFIFATTEPQKVLPTILSRCQRFDLRPIAARKIMERLAEIAKAEKVDVDEDALLAIARIAEGGLRDAESALDQLIAFRGKKIREEDVMSVFGLMARKTLEQLAGAILQGDVARAVETVAELDEAGKDMQRIVVELLDYFRNALIFLSTNGDMKRLDITDGQVESLVEQTKGINSARLLEMIEILTTVDQALRYALSRRTLLEVAVIRCARAATVCSVDEVLEQINRLKESMAGALPQDSPQKKSSSYGRNSNTVAEPGAVKQASATDYGKSSAPESHSSRPQPAAGNETELLSEQWHEIVARVGRAAQLAKGYLIDAKPVSVSGSKVVIGFDPEFAEDKEKIDFPRNRKAIQNVLKDILHRPVSVEFTVLDSRDTLPGDIKMGKEEEEKSKKDPTAGGKRNMSKEAREQWMKDPTVREALELFDGDIVDIRE